MFCRNELGIALSPALTMRGTLSMDLLGEEMDRPEGEKKKGKVKDKFPRIL